MTASGDRGREPSLADLPARSVRATARCRVDLGGGTLDIWPLGLLFERACTVNVALDLAVEVTLETGGSEYRVRTERGELAAATPTELALEPDGALVGLVAEALALPPLTATLRSASPRGGGLGASSAVTVALIAAGDRLRGAPDRGEGATARLARDLEARMMRLPTGMQDHYGAMAGGALAIEYAPGGERVRRLAVDLEALGRHLLLVYTGQSHFSAATNWGIIRGCLEGDPEVRGLLHGIAEVAAELPAALEAADWPRAGELVGREWGLRRHLAEGVTVPEIESLLQIGRSLGAWGGKACGAGGGGCVALLLPAERRATVAQALTDAGGEVLSAAPTADGLVVAVE